MKLPQWNGVTRPSTHIFFLVCFVLGFAVVSVFSLGQVKHDDRKGEGWNPVSRMPDGKVGLSEFAIGVVGFAAAALVLALWRAAA